MLLDLDDDQYDFAGVVGGALAKRAGAGPARTLYESEAGSADEAVVAPVEDALRSLGVPGLTVAEAHGGSGLGLADCVLVLESLGRHLVPTPVADLVAVVAPLVARHGDARLASDLLPRIVAGGVRASVQDGWAGWAPWGAAADVVAVVLADRVVLAAPGPGNVETVPGTDRARRLGRVLPEAPVVAELGAAAAAEARARAAVSAALQLTGVASAMVELATEYARVRTQFGQQIGAFQAVKHQLADAFAAVEASHRTAWWAAICLDDPDAPELAEAVAVAKATIGEASRTASYAALQVHGGLGYTWECDLHLWMKRAQALQGSWGSTDAHLAALGELYASSVGRAG